MIVINGIPREEGAGQRLVDILEAEQYKISRVAVEINGEIVPRAMLEKTEVQDGDHLEVVSFVGGG